MCTQPVQPWDEIVIVGSLVDFRVETRQAIRAEIQEATRLRDVHVEPGHRATLAANLWIGRRRFLRSRSWLYRRCSAKLQHGSALSRGGFFFLPPFPSLLTLRKALKMLCEVSLPLQPEISDHLIFNIKNTRFSLCGHKHF